MRGECRSAGSGASDTASKTSDFMATHCRVAVNTVWFLRLCRFCAACAAQVRACRCLSVPVRAGPCFRHHRLGGVVTSWKFVCNLHDALF
eukprot:7383254-Prymnesium_polylepis.1